VGLKYISVEPQITIWIQSYACKKVLVLHTVLAATTLIPNETAMKSKSPMTMESKYKESVTSSLKS
jgi:hypothetical protein